MKMRMAIPALLVLALPMTPPAPSAAAADIPEVAARKTLRVIVARDTLPEAINLQPNGDPGLEREMLEAFASLQRLRVEYVVVATMADRIPSLLAGKGDVIAGMFGVTDERRKQVDFSVEVFPAHNIVVTRRPHPRIETLEELRRTRVGTMKTSSWAEAIATAGVAKENVDDSYLVADELLAALRAGRVAAIVMGTGWALGEAKKDPQLELGLILSRATRAWAVRKDSPELLKVLDEYMTNVRRTSTWSRLVVKYYGESALEILHKGRNEQ
jgi:polar amino acid transport system substrate-binding protein